MQRNKVNIVEEAFDEFAEYLLNSEDFINKLAAKLSEAVENNDVRLVCSDMIATLEWEEVQEQFEKNLLESNIRKMAEYPPGPLKEEADENKETKEETDGK